MWPRRGSQLFLFGQLCFQFPLILVSAEPGPEWKWKSLRVGEGLSTAFSTQRAEVERGTGWQSWSKDHHQGPDRAGRMWPRPSRISPGDLGGPPLEERGMKSKHIWLEVEPRAYISLILYHLPFSSTMKLMRTFHCIHALLLKYSTFHIFVFLIESWASEGGLQGLASSLSHCLRVWHIQRAQHVKGYWPSRESPLLPCGLGAFHWKITCEFQDSPYCIWLRYTLSCFQVLQVQTGNRT